MNEPNNENGLGEQNVNPAPQPEQPPVQPQQPQQPYAQPQQPYYQQPAPQQPYYQQPAPAPQPVVVAALPATEQEKTAYFKSGSSILMLVVCIVATLSLVIGIVSPLLNFDLIGFIFGLLGSVLGILILVGIWLVWANSKKKTLNPTAVKLIKIPYIIQFVFAVIGFAVMFIFDVIALTALGTVESAAGGDGALTLGPALLAVFNDVIPFIFTCIIFASLNKTLKVALTINNNVTTVGQKSSKTLGIVLIIAAAVNIILGLVQVILMPLLIMSFISTLIQAAYWIIGAIVLLGFAKNLNIAHGVN